MNQRKTKEIVRKKLHQIDGLFVRSEEEAKQLAAQCNVSARALIMRVEAKSSLPAESWAAFYQALDAMDQRARGVWREKMREAMRSLQRHRRLAIGSVMLVLALAFFTLVPAGRAIAERVFNYVISVFDKQLEVEQADEKVLYEARGYDVPEVLTQDQIDALEYDESGNLIMVSDPVYYDTVTAFEDVYKLDAFEFKTNSLKCVEVYEQNHLFKGKELRSSYRTEENLTVNVIEQWFTGDGQTFGFRDAIQKKTILGDKTMMYAIDSSNGTFDGIALLDHTILWIYADQGVDIDKIWEWLA